MFELASPAFENGGPIPQRFTCQGEDVSPALVWRGAPEETRSFALVVLDPDAPDPRAPRRTWIHWVIVDVPADADGIPEDAARKGLPAGAREGKNDWGRTGWGGPCPPIGRHRYFFRLFALDAALPDIRSPTSAELERAVKGHVLARTELMGTYEKTG